MTKVDSLVTKGLIFLYLLERGIMLTELSFFEKVYKTTVKVLC